MQELDSVIRRATALIEAEYFKLPIYGGPPIYRERVYCYELYHRMRCEWPAKEITPFILNGEVDKRAHQALEAVGINWQKPDLLVHIPGNWEDNFAIIEVKHVRGALGGPKKDLETLALFRQKAGYRRALYLVYGTEVDDDLIGRIQEAAAGIDGARGTEIWFHVEVGQPAFQCASLV